MLFFRFDAGFFFFFFYPSCLLLFLLVLRLVSAFAFLGIYVAVLASFDGFRRRFWSIGRELCLSADFESGILLYFFAGDRWVFD